MLEYKGYFGSVEYSAEDNILYGKILGIKGLVSYEGDSIYSLRADFEIAVDDYIETFEKTTGKPEFSVVSPFYLQRL